MRNQNQVYVVTLAEGELPTPPSYHDDSVPKLLDDKTLREFFERHSAEVAFARDLLESAPVGTKLRSHFRNKRFVYTKEATGKAVALKHTYIKTGPGTICVQITRGDASLIGVGSFGEVKGLYPIPTHFSDAQTYPIAVKKFRDNPHTFLTSVPAELTGVIATVEKPANPFKQASVTTKENPFVEMPLWEGSSIMLRFNPAEFRIQKPKKKYQSESLEEVREGSKKYPDRAVMLQSSRRMDTELFKLLLDIHKGKKEHLSPSQVFWIALIASSSVYLAHKSGYIHRDIKPQNILVDKNYNPFLCDWDFAVHAPDGKSVKAKPAGTPGYLPYELAPYLSNSNGMPSGEFQKHFPIFSHIKNEIPQQDSPPLVTPGFDVYALGVTFEKLSMVGLSRENRHISEMRFITALMTCYHPEGRFSLHSMRLALFSLYWMKKNGKPIENDDEVAQKRAESFKMALQENNLPLLPEALYFRITHIVCRTAKLFIEVGGWETRESKQIFLPKQGSWRALAVVKTYLEVAIEYPDVAAFTALEKLLSLLEGKFKSFQDEFLEIILTVSKIHESAKNKAHQSGAMRESGHYKLLELILQKCEEYALNGIGLRALKNLVTCCYLAYTDGKIISKTYYVIEKLLDEEAFRSRLSKLDFTSSCSDSKKGTASTFFSQATLCLELFPRGYSMRTELIECCFSLFEKMPTEKLKLYIQSDFSPLVTDLITRQFLEGKEARSSGKPGLFETKVSIKGYAEAISLAFLAPFTTAEEELKKLTALKAEITCATETRCNDSVPPQTVMPSP